MLENAEMTKGRQGGQNREDQARGGESREGKLLPKTEVSTSSLKGQLTGRMQCHKM